MMEKVTTVYADMGYDAAAYIRNHLRITELDAAFHTGKIQNLLCQIISKISATRQDL